MTERGDDNKLSSLQVQRSGTIEEFDSGLRRMYTAYNLVVKVLLNTRDILCDHREILLRSLWFPTDDYCTREWRKLSFKSFLIYNPGNILAAQYLFTYCESHN